mgnify:CR=1 FL=1
METYQLKEIAKVIAGSTAPKDKNFNMTEGLPFIRAGHLDFLCEGGDLGELPKVHINNKLVNAPVNTLLFAKSGMSCMKNRLYVTRREAYIVNHLAGIICNKRDININYLKYYFIKNPPNKLVNDTAYPSIRLSDIENISISIPSFEEQNKIVNILDKSMLIINKRKNQINACDELIKSRFIIKNICTISK